MEAGGGRAAGVLAALLSTRPTRRGLQVLYAAGVFLLLGLERPHATLYAGSALLGALYLVGHLGAARAGASLAVSCDASSRVFAWEEFPVRVTVRNAGPRTVRGVFALETAAAAEPAGAVGEVPPGGTRTIELRARVRRRGVHRIPPPAVEILWPFGLARWRPAPPGSVEVLAYPRRIPVACTRPPSAATPEAAPRAAAVASPRGGEALRGIREWCPGDPARGIAWRASVRHGRLLSREFERLEPGSVVVALDADPRALPVPERPVAFERALSAAASLLLRLRAEGRRASFAAWTPEPLWVPAATGPAGLAEALERLALHRSVRPADPARDPLALVPRARLRGAEVVLVRASGTPVTRPALRWVRPAGAVEGALP